MTCNGNNHRPGCDCGWGGVFHGLGLGTNGNYWGRADSYTNPNARCPRCSARVYFYRSPDGGTVYFDDLGPPWPKHPCMDTGRQSLPPGRTRQAMEKHSWKIAGWHPMQCNNIVTIKDDVNIIALITGEGRDSRQLFAKKPTATISHHSPILWRRFEGQRGHYEISTLDLSDPGYKEIRLEAFDNLNQVKNLIINERRDANIKIFDARMARLKQELINELQISGVKTKLDVEILKFQQNLLNYGDLAENTRRATDALKICIEKEIQARERARLAQAIYDELVAEGARLEKEFAEVGVDL